MKRRMTLVGQLILLIILGTLIAGNMGWIRRASGQNELPTALPPRTEVTLNTYALLASEVRSDILAWSAQGAAVLDNPATLYASVKDGFGTVVYLDQEALLSLDEDWVRAKYRTGVAFVGVGVALSELGAKVGAKPDVPDLDMSYARGRTQVSLCFEHSAGLARRSLFYTDFWEDLTPLPVILERPLEAATN